MEHANSASSCPDEAIAGEQRLPTGHWYPVEHAKKVRRGILPLVRFGRELVLWRDDAGNLACLESRCPHRGADLSRGKIIDGGIECPYHKFRFSPQGQCVATPFCSEKQTKEGRLEAPHYPVAERHGFVWLWLGETRESYPPVPWFENIPETTASCVTSVEFKTGFTRVVENLLDLLHFPSVHMRLKHDDYMFERFKAEKMEDNLIFTEAILRDRRSGEIASSFHAWLRLPSVALLAKPPHYFIYAAVPIDGSTTLVLNRYLSTWWRPLAKLSTWIAAHLDLKRVWPEDRWVLDGMEDRQADQYVAADKAIGIWRSFHKKASASRETSVKMATVQALRHRVVKRPSWARFLLDPLYWPVAALFAVRRRLAALGTKKGLSAGVFLLIAFFPSQSQAYIDPGTGGLIYQMGFALFSLLVGGLLFPFQGVKRFFLGLFRRKNDGGKS